MIVWKLGILDLPLLDAFVVRPLKFEDDRGIFYKSYTEELLAQKHVKPYFAEESLSVSKKGALRGLHYQSGNYSQAKLVRCTKGKVFDVIVDLRKDSKTYGKWHGIELSEENALSLYVPRGFAHGFLALSEGASLNYKSDNPYSPKHECGVYYADDTLGIVWPSCGKRIISEKDSKLPSFEKCEKF
jgi:dTDP-4-dehydrorhamnose 3,5-epimerase